MIHKDNMSRCNSWVTISIPLASTCKCITLTWTCKIHKFQGLSIPISAISLELEKLKSFRPGHICIALSRTASIKGIFLTSSFKKDAIKANVETSKEHELLRKEALFTIVST